MHGLFRLNLDFFFICGNICSCKLSATVSLMLDNPFPVPPFCKLNHISVCFIQFGTKITCKLLISFREINFFFGFEVIHSVLGHWVNFNITKDFYKDGSYFPTIFPFLVTKQIYFSATFLKSWVNSSDI